VLGKPVVEKDERRTSNFQSRQGVKKQISTLGILGTLAHFRHFSGLSGLEIEELD